MNKFVISSTLLFRQSHRDIFPWYLSVFVLLVIFRIYFFVQLDSSIILTEISYFQLFLSFLRDLQFVFFTLIFHTLSVFYFQYKAYKFIKYTYFFPPFIILLCCLFLDQYYLITNEPLDEGIYLFTWKELWMILGLQNRLTFFVVFVFIVLLISYFILANGFKLLLSSLTDVAYLRALLLTLLIGLSLPLCIYHSDDFPDNDPIVNNKLAYFSRQSVSFFSNPIQIKNSIRWQEFKSLDPTFYGTDLKSVTSFPTWHAFTKKSSLSKHFRKTSNGKPPNIVLIVVESMSSDFVGLHSNKTGGLMPFLDSLSKQALYFPNTFSSSQRTHNVLPAILCSTPNTFNGAVFQQLAFPNHWSLINLLRENYYSRFYCGVDLNYLNMLGFMNYHKVNYTVENWSPECRSINQQTNSPWGYPDEVLFRQSLLDSGRSSPTKSRLDIFLTISSHDPFIYPSKDKYTSKVMKALPSISNAVLKEKIASNASSFGSFMYSDDQIRSFMESCKKQVDYDNTIFIITGDHGTELLNTNKIAKYNVPLLIYSPLLKTPFVSKSVVSHIDIAPSILSYLKEDYKLILPDSVPFVGRELSFSTHFSAKRKLIFTTNKLKSNELMYDDKVLLGNRIYRFDEHFNLFPIIDKGLRAKFIKTTQLYELFSRYCIHQDKLVPIVAHRKWIGNEFWKLISSNTIHPLSSQKNGLSFVGDVTIPLHQCNTRIELTGRLYCHAKSDINKLGDLVIKINKIPWLDQEKLVFKAIRPIFKFRFLPNNWNQISYVIEFNPMVIKKIQKNKHLYCFLYDATLKEAKIKDVILKTFQRN